MERREIVDSVRDTINTVLKTRRNEELIEADTELAEAIGINSIDAISILVKIEEVFDINIEDEDLSAELVKTINTMADYIENKLRLKEAS